MRHAKELESMTCTPEKKRQAAENSDEIDQMSI